MPPKPSLVLASMLRQNLTKILCTSDKGTLPAMINALATFPSNRECVTADKCICFQNTMAGQAQDRHPYSKIEKLEKETRVWVQNKFRS